MRQTSALDVASETKMYTLLQSNRIVTKQQSELDDYGKRKQKLGLTYVSIGHRPTIAQYHSRQLNLIDGTRFELTEIRSTSGTDPTTPESLF